MLNDKKNKIENKIKSLKDEIKILSESLNNFKDDKNMFSGLFQVTYEFHILQLKHLINVLEILKEI